MDGDDAVADRGADCSGRTLPFETGKPGCRPLYSAISTDPPIRHTRLASSCARSTSRRRLFWRKRRPGRAGRELEQWSGPLEAATWNPSTGRATDLARVR